MNHRHPLMPADTPDFMRDAWASCLLWAAGNADIIEDFRKATGNRFTPGSSALERQIDFATGAAQAYTLSFIKWFNENIWGTEVCPDATQAEARDADRGSS